MKFSVIIKGTPQQAIRKLIEHKCVIYAETLRETSRETVVVVDSNLLELQKWFAEDQRRTVFPVGALLHFGEVTETTPRKPDLSRIGV